jgi:hypothetical protein
MTGEKVYNPYINYLTNERKLKLKKEESDGTVKWYDFVIKDVKESSDSRAFNYTCKS